MVLVRWRTLEPCFDETCENRSCRRREGVAPDRLCAQRRQDESRRLVRETLASVLGISPQDVTPERRCLLCGDPSHGKPRLPRSGLDFSVSHSGLVMGIAIVDAGMVGLDVEADSALTQAAEARKLVVHADDPSGWTELQLWVAKEAVLKATGRGLTITPSTFSVISPRDAAVVELIDTLPGYTAALATITGHPSMPGPESPDVCRTSTLRSSWREADLDTAPWPTEITLGDER